MEDAEQSKKFITDSKNICIVPDQEPQAIICALALFYTLKELNKNVNLIIEDFPENLKFLIPSLNFISYPKNFIISIPNKVSNISQVYYEKDDDNLKIHLTSERGLIKKDDISFYFSAEKPDIIITLGIKDYKAFLAEKLNSFGFLLDSPILNIDTLGESGANEQNLPGQTGNKNFGKINLLEGGSITETVFTLIKNINPVKFASQSEAVSRETGQFNGVNNDSVKKETASCLLAGIVIYTENFKNKITADIFEIASNLIKNGADLKQIVNSIYKTT